MALMMPEVAEPLELTQAHTVVLVDDDPAVLRALRRVLGHEPYRLLSTVHPELALDWIEHEEISLVLVDQRMPDMCGTELAERVRRSSPRTIRVMLTAYPGNALVKHGLARDVQWLISKPWSDDALRLALRSLLKNRETRPPPDPRPRMLRSMVDAAGRAVRGMARGLGWALGLLGSTDAGGFAGR